MGFDPISYFIDGQARPGNSRFQASFGGVVWHFTSEGNRAAFVESPQSYVPAFGGYDAVAAASGLIVAGNPQHFVVQGSRLYLFRHAENRALFLAQSQIAREAERNWPELRHRLAP